MDKVICRPKITSKVADWRAFVGHPDIIRASPKFLVPSQFKRIDFQCSVDHFLIRTLDLKPAGSLSLSQAETGNLQFNRIQIPFILPPDREGSPAYGTAVCPSPNDAYDVDTGRCYPVGPGTVGPCGPLAEYQRNAKNPTYGECKCMNLPGCGRPLSYWPDHNRTCFELYTQGPCTADEWLVPARDVTSMCVPNLCYRYTPYYGNKDSSVLSFAFSHYGECFYTETQAFCRPNQVARFLDGQNAAICDDIGNQNQCMSQGVSSGSGYAAAVSNDFGCPGGQVLAAGGECVNEDPLE